MKICIEKYWMFGATNTLEPLEYNCAENGQGEGHTGTCHMEASLTSLS